MKRKVVKLLFMLLIVLNICILFNTTSEAKVMLNNSYLGGNQNTKNKNLNNYNALKTISCKHSWTLTSTKKATCTTNGTNYYKCKYCPQTKSELTPKASHRYTIIDHKGATCNSNGYKVERCMDCSNTKTTILYRLSHNFVSNNTSNKYLKTPATCTSQAEYYYSCSLCGGKSSRTFKSGELAPHAYQLNTATYREATCTQKGYSEYNCSNCGSTYILNPNKKPHEYASSYKVENDGHTLIEKCKCGQEIKHVKEAHSYTIDGKFCICGKEKASHKPVHFIVVGGLGQSEASSNNILNQGAVQDALSGEGDYSTFIPATREDNGNFVSSSTINQSQSVIRESANNDDEITVVLVYSLGGEVLYHVDTDNVDAVIIVDGASSIPNCGYNDAENLGKITWTGIVEDIVSDGTPVYVYATDGREDRNKVSGTTRYLVESVDGMDGVTTENVGGEHGSACVSAAEEVAGVISGLQ